MSERQDTAAYREKKQFFARMLTVFGRNPVLEALRDTSLKPYRLHLADSNKPSESIREMTQRAQSRGVEIVHHSRAELGRISRNARQDQGVALDVECEGFAPEEALIEQLPQRLELIALDRITNPQNLGMIVRSVCASPAHGLLLPEKGCAALDALVIKASAGTLFKARLYRCKDLAATLNQLARHDCGIYGLDARGDQSLGSFTGGARNVFVLGNETEGLSAEVARACTGMVSIPMCNGVESLNVSIAASLLAFRSLYRPG